jgi:predicted CXXCH cytochrome family protein
MSTRFHSILALGGLLLCLPVFGDSIVNSKHNLSLSGPGDLKAATETEVCIFCHTPHNATSEAPLWNRHSSGATYIPYNSTTMKARVGQPTGSSKLCLSCHDGTVALGLVRSRPTPIQFQRGIVGLPADRRSNLGTDLSDDHPVSFTYDSALALESGQLQDPATLNQRVRLDPNKQLQCTSCHDPHDNRYGNFLVQDNIASGLCLQCHNMTFWTQSEHRISGAVMNWQTFDPPWPKTNHTTVAANGCESCHAPHNAGTRQRLLNFAETAARPQPTCLACHNGRVAGFDIKSEFNKFSMHDLTLNLGAHDPTEDVVPAMRHVACADCHNPHAARSGAATAPTASGPLAGVRGVTAAGTPVQTITRQSELCYRCHGDSLSNARIYVDRQNPQPNLRLAFSTANASFHPVEAAGKNLNVPSLLNPWRTTSMMYCTDCHNNNQGPNAGGTGPNGPHGSTYAPILERQQVFDTGPENPAAYALCYKCHDRNTVLNETRSFKYHRLHVQEENASCTTCHDPHGVQGNARLINFDTKYVTANRNGQLSYLSTGPFSGTCSLRCHGVNHNNMRYSP